LQFSGEFEVPASPQQAWTILTKPDRFASIIPDVKNFAVKDAKSFYAEFPVKLGALGGTAKMNFSYEKLDFPRHIKLVGNGTAPQSKVNLAIDLKMTQVADGSKLNWSADVHVGGIVASVGSGLIEGFSRKKMDQIITGLQVILKSEP